MTSDFDLAKQIRAVVDIDPDAPALEYRKQWFTWGHMAAFMDATAALFAQAGLREGAPVGILLRNNPASICALLEVLASRRCIITLNPFQSADKIVEDFRNTPLSAIVAEESDWAAVPALVGAARDAGCLAIVMNTSTLEVYRHPDVPLPAIASELDMGGTAILMQSSGTTGPAKRIPLPYQQFEQSIRSAAVYESKGLPGAALTLKQTPAMLTTPLVHIGGMYFSVSAMVVGRPLVIFDKFNATEWADAVEAHKISVTALPPTALQMVLDANIPASKLASIRIVRAGSAPLSQDLQDRFETTYGIPVLDSYGATEFAGAIAGWSLKDHEKYRQSKRGSVGRAQPGNELRVVDAETGLALPAGQVGLLEVRSAQMDSTRWVRTNDLAELDEDGFLFIRGRADAAIIRGGFKIIPADVEAILKQHEAVHDACIVGLPDTRLGTVPAAAVTLKPGSACDESELLAYLKNRLVSYQVPVMLIVTDSMPRTPSLKISQPEVKAMILAAIASSREQAHV